MREPRASNLRWWHTRPGGIGWLMNTSSTHVSGRRSRGHSSTSAETERVSKNAGYNLCQIIALPVPCAWGSVAVPKQDANFKFTESLSCRGYAYIYFMYGQTQWWCLTTGTQRMLGYNPIVPCRDWWRVFGFFIFVVFYPEQIYYFFLTASDPFF